MNERIKELGEHFNMEIDPAHPHHNQMVLEKFAELIVREMCGMMEQAEDDCYHLFEASERPTEYTEWLNQWQIRFKEHYGVE